MASLADDRIPGRGPEHFGERLAIRKDLPRGLLPAPDSALLPPTSCLGWSFDAPQVVALSKKYDIAVFDSVDPDDDSDEDDDDEPSDAAIYHTSLGVARDFSVVFTAAAIAEHLLKEAGVAIPFKDPLKVVLRPEGARIAVVLCDNYHYDCKPTDAQVCKLMQLFGFTEEATWMLDTHNSDWSEKAKGSRASQRPHVTPQPQQHRRPPSVREPKAMITDDRHPRRGPGHLGERIVPLKELPHSLLPDPNSALLPPTYCLGWPFGAQQVVLLSKKYNIAVFNPEDDDDDEDDDEEEPSDDEIYHAFLGVPRNFNVVFTAAAIAEHLLKEAGVVIPFEDPLKVVCLPEGARMAVVLCDNYHYGSKPTEAQVCKLMELFGFSEEPTWMLDTHNSDWSEKAKGPQASQRPRVTPPAPQPPQHGRAPSVRETKHTFTDECHPRCGPEHLGQRIVPLKDLPHSLLPDPNSALLPPTYCLGWPFSAQQVVSLSKKYNIAVFNPEDSDDEDDEDDDEEEPSDDEIYHAFLGVARNFNVVFTAAAIAEHLLKEARVVIPFEDPLKVVCLPEGARMAVVLCDNYHYGSKPTEAQLRKLQELFGFAEGPTWMLDAHNSDWRE